MSSQYVWYKFRATDVFIFESIIDDSLLWNENHVVFMAVLNFIGRH